MIGYISHLTVGVNGDEFFEQTSIPTSPPPLPTISGSSIVAAPRPKKYDDLSSAPFKNDHGTLYVKAWMRT